MEKNLEKRMYFFTIYQLTGIQAGIQCGHAALEYINNYGNNEEYADFQKNWKTWIVLNGGTTNNRFELGTGIPVGTLNQIVEQLQQNAIEYGHFQEPDLNDALTAVCFLADERVWNYEDYPDFLNWVLKNIWYDEPSRRIVELRMMSTEELISMIPDHYEEWVEFLGGEKNVFLRELIRGKKLA